MRFFTTDQFNEDVYAVVDGPRRRVVLLLGRGGTHRFRNPAHVEIESSSWTSFRVDICEGCKRRGKVDFGLLCAEGLCPKEVTPR